MMTSEPIESSDIAVVCDKRGRDAVAMDGYLKARSLAAQWYALRDLDALNGDVCEGRIKRLIFARVEDLLEGIFNEEIQYARWVAGGAQVDFVESPGADLSGCLAVLGQAWDKHRHTRRRRQTVAGLILSIIVVVAAFVVVRF